MPIDRPFFSIVTPVYNPPREALADCLVSVEHQSYGGWEHCIVDDASPDDSVRALLDSHAQRHDRVKLHFRTENGGIVAASNDAFELATGEFIVLLDHDDMLDRDALALARECLLEDPTIDVLYSDSDKLDPEGNHFDEFKKPDWSPERLRWQNYLIQMTVLRRRLVEELGGFRAGFDGSQDHDLILRVTERARSIRHLPRTLYHWRQVPGSVATDVLAKPTAFEAGERAVQEHCDRIGLRAAVNSSSVYPGIYRISRTPQRQPSVSIIVPTVGSSRKVWGQDHVLVLQFLENVMSSTKYEDLEVILVVDPATPEDVVQRLRRVHNSGVRLVWGEKPFNWSRTCNWGCRTARGEFLLFMNDDMFVRDPHWLQQLVAIGLEPDVGAVGPLLIYEDSRIQSAGHCHNGEPNHIGRLASSDEPGPFSLFQVARECSGVTGACLLTPRAVFEEVGGMCEDFPNSYNDVDYCIKVRSTGHRIVWTPVTRVSHFEESSRDQSVNAADHDRLYARWRREFVRDHYVPDGPWALHQHSTRAPIGRIMLGQQCR